MIVSVAQACASYLSPPHPDAYPPIDLDVATLADLLENNKQALHLFLPLNTKRSLSATLQQAYKIHELDWWDSCRMDVDGIGSIKVTCTPAQHFSGRGLFDRNASLWASWAIEGLHRGTGESRMKVNERM
jgi:L-ascorbate metabolism protein UlaG (beta-lactamase superfamily)